MSANGVQRTIVRFIELGKLSKQIFGKSWEFGPTGSLYVGIPQKEKKLRFFCILGYSKHIIFSLKSLIFLVIGDF